MRLTKFAVCCVAAASLIHAADERKPAERLEASAEVLNELVGAPDKGVPKDIFSKAQCVVVIPGLKKGAFVIGAKYGKGFMSCRTGNGWSAPAAMKVEGGSVGFQIGGSETDVVMLVMNKTGADKLMRSKFTLGADGSVAAGPLGREGSAQTDAMMRAEILSYSRARGVFAGVSLEGATLRPDDDWNRELYGHNMTTKAIINSATPPAAAAPFLSALRHDVGRHS